MKTASMTLENGQGRYNRDKYNDGTFVSRLRYHAAIDPINVDNRT